MEKNKKKILFVIDSLGIGGAEKSLVTLLNLMDENKYEIDLQLFGYGGAFQSQLPDFVNLLPPLDYFKFLNKGKYEFKDLIHVKYLLGGWRYSWAIKRKKVLHVDKARLFWKYGGGCIKNGKKEYDVAIAYAQGVPTFYVADKIIAKKKIAWINVHPLFSEENKTFLRDFYRRFDFINLVSEVSRKKICKIYPGIEPKTVVIHDILSPRMIKTGANQECPLKFDKNIFNIITVARLIRLSKGYDILLQTVKMLKDRKLSFHWYVLGDGDYRKEMEKFIKVNDLDNFITLVGAVANPYPYMKQADLYVQTSRHEGFGISIAEARVLNIPIVTTAYNGVEEQMIQGKNGIVVPIEPVAVADAIIDLINNPDKRKVISDFQATEQIGNESEIEKLYALIDVDNYQKNDLI